MEPKADKTTRLQKLLQSPKNHVKVRKGGWRFFVSSAGLTGICFGGVLYYERKLNTLT